jgi:hypothetical protein
MTNQKRRSRFLGFVLAAATLLNAEISQASPAKLLTQKNPLKILQLIEDVKIIGQGLKNAYDTPECGYVIKSMEYHEKQIKHTLSKTAEETKRTGSVVVKTIEVKSLEALVPVKITIKAWLNL